MTDNKITAYRNTTTGNLAPPDQVGQTANGRRVFRAVAGWEPVNAAGQGVEVDRDGSGNWIEAAG